MSDLNYQEQVLATLAAGERDEWTVADNVAVSQRYEAEFWFEDDGTPRLEFDHFIAGHLLLEPNELEDPKAILREIDIEVARWIEHDMDFEAAREFDRQHPEAWVYLSDDEATQTTCVDPDHGIGDHPCDEVLGKAAAAAQRDATPALVLTIPDALVDVTVFALNHFGTGEHPIAERANLPYFLADYVRECLECMAESDKVNDDGHTAARAALAAL